MSIKLNNVPIGRDDKRKFHDFTHDVNTTADFGFCQPTLVLPVMPNSHVNLKSSSFVRLGVMPCPTFGRIKIQQDQNQKNHVQDLQNRMEKQKHEKENHYKWKRKTKNHY